MTDREDAARAQPDRVENLSVDEVGRSGLMGPDARYTGSIPRSPRPRKPSQARSPSSATASCTCPAPPGASTATWREGPGPWLGGRAASSSCPTSTPPLLPRQSSAPITTCASPSSPPPCSILRLEQRYIRLCFTLSVKVGRRSVQWMSR